MKRQQRASFEAIGTRWNIQVNEPLAKDAWQALFDRIEKRIELFDKTYSRFRADSLIKRMSESAGDFTMPQDGFKLLQFYEHLYKLTDGRLTPLIGQMMVEAGYDAQYSFVEGELKQPPKWEEVLAYDKNHITIKQPVLLDFGAAGKGYLVDIIGELIEASGIKNYVIDAGGDILHRSVTTDDLQVGLENPHDTAEAIGVARLSNKSLCASAGSKRKWGSFHHIIDPTTLQSPNEILASWVIASDTMTADGLATALLLGDGKKLFSHYSFSYAMLYPDMSFHHTKDFPVTTFETLQ